MSFSLQDLEHIDYYCPDCRENSKRKFSAPKTSKPKIKYVTVVY